MAQLAKGVNATGIVKEVEESFDKFLDTKSETGGLRHCHKALIDIDGEEFVIQLCTTYERLTEFGVGDTLHFLVKSFSKGMYTIDVISVKRFQPGKIKDPLEYEPVMRHLNLAGTPEALALQAAVAFHCYKPESKLEDVTDMAHSLCVWLRTEYELNTQD